MTMTEESKSYSLSNLEDWLEDAINADTTPNEVYDRIVDTVKKNMRYHKACYDSSVKLLGLLRGNKNISVMDGITTETMDGITIGQLTEDGSGSVHELNTDYYNTSMFDLTSTFLDGNVNISDKD
tara:strand:+ start:592 stop:966 length:375 start_codon:yes stop_codon:yes gene_type:complete